MPDPKTPPVAHGDRRREVWVEDDSSQGTKVRHTWPTPPEDDVTDVAVTPDEPSAWEAVEDDD